MEVLSETRFATAIKSPAVGEARAAAEVDAGGGVDCGKKVVTVHQGRHRQAEAPHPGRREPVARAGRSRKQAFSDA
ncbi:hypothetical protein [Microtetraspora fusca]|uniref:hypothetical protein n=1 Tax=Microtetraspora fusca TaxID=1997 RepID=UPI000AFB1970|nr:hypothetical protein [Microtetraspora fusca]